jgi:hypothetical protein
MSTSLQLTHTSSLARLISEYRLAQDDVDLLLDQLEPLEESWKRRVTLSDLNRRQLDKCKTRLASISAESADGQRARKPIEDYRADCVSRLTDMESKEAKSEAECKQVDTKWKSADKRVAPLEAAIDRAADMLRQHIRGQATSVDESHDLTLAAYESAPKGVRRRVEKLCEEVLEQGMCSSTDDLRDSLPRLYGEPLVRALESLANQGFQYASKRKTLAQLNQMFNPLGYRITDYYFDRACKDPRLVPWLVAGKAARRDRSQAIGSREKTCPNEMAVIALASTGIMETKGTRAQLDELLPTVIARAEAEGATTEQLEEIRKWASADSKEEIQRYIELLHPYT